jgi:hypothetical protein
MLVQASNSKGSKAARPTPKAVISPCDTADFGAIYGR